jgi:hypothetical protein
MRSFFSKLAALAALGPMAWGWGPTGHRAIAQIAWLHLSPRAQAEIRKLLESGETLESVSTWADEVRANRKESAPWHYVNVPVWISGGEWAPYCPAEGCVVRKVHELASALKRDGLERTERVETLKYLVHFLGDLHQPLHSGDRKDRGGNDLPVVFFGRPSNLHSIWDSAIVERMFEREPQLKTQLAERTPLEQRQEWQRGSINDWFWETRQFSREVAYASVGEARPAALGAAYQAEAEVVVWKQLRRAGVRLARILNEVWPE